MFAQKQKQQGGKQDTKVQAKSIKPLAGMNFGVGGGGLGLMRRETWKGDLDLDSENGPPVDPDDLDHRVTMLDIIRITSEMISPNSRTDLQWMLDNRELVQADERVSLLDYVETELIFTEFLRFVVGLAELIVQWDTEQQSASWRFETFMRKIFLPALKTAYVPPVLPKEEEEEATPDQDTSAAEEPSLEQATEQAEGEVATGASEAENQSGSEIESDEAEEEPVDLEVWRGFAFGSPVLPEGCAVVRWWPDGYETEVLRHC